MKFRLVNSFSKSPNLLMRSCGYKSISDKKTGKKSFVRNLSNQHYPRFHVYLKINDQELVVDLHLDQTKALYSQQTAHRADYESDQVRTELFKIYQEFKKSIV